ncbi:MAG: ABC transporter substrate-binding protein [Candidatus Binatia bacterium]
MKRQLVFQLLLQVVAAAFLVADVRFVYSDERTIEGAKKEGALLLYSGIPIPDAKELLAAFQKKYPFIKTNHYRSRGAKLISRIQAESRAGRNEWDVFNSTGLEGYVLLEEGVFAKYDSPERAFFPPGHKDNDGFWTTMYTTPMIATYNTELVKARDVPKSYSDLLEPMWQGKLALDPREIEWYANLRKIWGKEKTRGFFVGLTKQNILLREGRTLLTQLLSAGEFSIVVNNYIQNVIEMKDKGAPIEWLFLDPVIESAGPIGINKSAPHRNAAKLFVDFSLSKEGQELLVKQGRSSARNDVKGNPRDLIKSARLVPSDLRLGKHYVDYRKEYEQLLGVKK